MRTIETLLRVGKDHTVNIKIKLPKEFAPGDYNALVVMDEKSQRDSGGEVRTPLNVIHSWNWDTWPKSSIFRREEIYGTDGR